MKFSIIGIVLLFDIAVSKWVKNSRTCSTPICVQEAANILKNMDATVDPCDNFYQFACGKYVKETKIPDDKIFLNGIATLMDQVQESIVVLITKTKNCHRLKPFRLLKQLYKECIDVERIERHGLTSLLKILDKFGDWPVRVGGSWKNDKFDWRRTIYGLRKLGINLEAFLSISVEIDPKDSSRRLISINQPSLGLTQEVLVKGLENNIVKGYYDYMVNVAVVLGANYNFAMKDLKASLECEIDIAKVSLSAEEWWNATALYNPMTMQELVNRYPSIPWYEYINNVFDVSDILINPNEIVIIKVPTYLDELEKLLKRLPKRVQANYIFWRTIHYVIPYLPSKLRNKLSEFEQIQNGNSAHQSRKHECFNDLSEKMELAMGALYARNHFSEDARNNVRSIVDDLISAFRNMLKNLKWTDEKTRKHALEKAAAMTKYVGYADEMLDDNALRKYYEKLQLTSDDYLMNTLDVRRFLWYKHYKTLRDPVNKTEWITRIPPLMVNAVYSPAENSLQVPAAILQNAFFHKDRPQYLNYGAIGTIIGHEITHGFDDFGRHFDKNGDLVDWWTEDTHKAFIQKTQCFIDQYNNISIPEVQLHINGKRTLNENIADNGGLTEAYLAYELWKEKNGPEPQLPDLNYTASQLFWISTANIFCTNDRPEYLKLSVLLNPHAPLGFRILGSFRNNHQFAKDFNCPVNSKMNPTEKCYIW